jgi:hypothetical protein
LRRLCLYAGTFYRPSLLGWSFRYRQNLRSWLKFAQRTAVPVAAHAEFHAVTAGAGIKPDGMAILEHDSWF